MIPYREWLVRFSSLRGRCFLLALTALLALPSFAQSAQSPSSPSVSSSANPAFSDPFASTPEDSGRADSLGPDHGADLGSREEGGPRLAETDSPPGTSSGRPQSSLSADRIFAVLQEQPDAMVELKSLMASVAQQQGRPFQPDAITDEMLYSEISSSAALRVNVTNFLRARGYVSNSQLTSSADRSDDNAGPDEADHGVSYSPSRRLPQNFPAGNNAVAAGSENAPEIGPSSVSSQQAAGLRGYASQAALDDRSHTEDERPQGTRARNGSAEPKVLRRPAPYNLLSLRDLYTQLPEQTAQLKRFGSEVFLNHSLTNQVGPGPHETPLDVSAGAGYIVGPGDSLTIALWGGISQNITRVIDREGRVSLPESGEAQVAGLTLERVEEVISQALRLQYRDVQVAVTLSHLRSIRVFVVGDVQRPGAYDISSLSTSLNALYAAGGPTSIGSLRLLRHYRGKQLIGEIDLYDFFLHGVQTEDRLEAGDTLLVPPAGPQVAVDGAVKRPAIYELKGPASLAALLEDAGGATVAAELSHIVVDRIDANRQRETVGLDLSSASDPESARTALTTFVVHDGDRIHVSPILPYSERLVYLEGHVARPGRTFYRGGMQLNDVLHSYQDLLPEPADKGEIVRLMPPDLHPETIEFSVPDVMIGNGNIALLPFDTVRVYGRYEADAPRVTIAGEVLRPGVYALSAEMTAAQLVRMAGGFKRDALLNDADLISYQTTGGTKVASQRTSLRIGDAVLQHERSADATLKPGDTLTVHQITGWNDIGASITIAGEVAHPGSYGIQQGERLSSILQRAGGFRETSYPAGAVLVREEVRRLEEKSREELIRQIETSSTAARIGPNLGSGDQSATLQLIAQQQEQMLARLKSQPAVGRVVIHISDDIASWANTPADIEVRAGDMLRIPKRPGFVLVSGQVYNTSAITFAPDKTARWYLQRAGGTTEVANTRDIFIIRANGSVVGRGTGSWLGHDVLGTRLDPGDVLVVPQKIIGASLFWRNLLTVAQVASTIAITAAVSGVL